MSLTLLPRRPVIAMDLTVPFAASGGTEPYVYSILPNGIGGSINSSTGVYTSPHKTGTDIVRVVDSLGNIAARKIYVKTALELLCDILQTELTLADDHIYLWDQKINQPTDSSMYVAVSVISCKPFSNTNSFQGNGTAIQSTNFSAQVGIDIISRSYEAVERKEEVIMALNSFYAESQQEINSFRIFPLSSSFINLSYVDGAAILYRFHIECSLQYFISKAKSVDYYNDFEPVTVTTEP